MYRTGLLVTLAFGVALLGCSKTTTERLQLPPLEPLQKTLQPSGS